MRYPLAGEVVVDLSTGIPGAYATKVLADGGADVVKVEPPGGDPLRRWTAADVELPAGEDGALFQFLACSKRSVVADVERVRDLVRGADGVVWSPGPIADQLPPAELRVFAPHATVLAVTPFGLEGPWAGRPATDGTLQAWAGGPAQRGQVPGTPLICGGRLGDWEAGMVAAVSYLVSRHRRVATGVGELVDVSALEAQCLTMTMYPVTYFQMAGQPMRPVRVSNLPGIHAAKDGFVGFMVVTGQQWLDFAAMVERPDWVDDQSLLLFRTRIERRHELLPVIDAWMAARTAEEIAELATLFRIPVAVLGNGATLPHADHLVANDWYVRNPRGGFLQPDVPYTLGGSASRRPAAAPPRLGEHSTEVVPGAPRPAPTTTTVGRPFNGLRVADFTTNWAGPIISHVLALFGADVIKVESAARPDPLRYNTVKTLQDDEWWEWSPLQHGPNTGKRDLTLDMSSARGRELALELVRTSDVVLENFSPRVMESWGLDGDAVLAANPEAVYVRAPAYGLTGPWRERVGYAQTIEMTAGLAWLTGHPDGVPEIPNGPCDPIAGLHATIALLLALEHRRVTGEGMVVECPMVGGALNLGAEQVVEHSAYGTLLERIGNRSPAALLQDYYEASDDDLPAGQGRWVAISAETDEQLAALGRIVGPLDGLGQWCRARRADDIVDELWAAGVPVAKLLLPYETVDLPQLQARRFFTSLSHPVVGDVVHAGFPAVFSAGPDPAELHPSPPPLLGEHNHEVLAGVLGLGDDEIAALEADGVIGTRPSGGTAW